MTDPSPDCGYTDAERDNGLRAAIAVYVAVVADEDASESAVLEADQALAEQTQRTDQAFEEIARLREFGEHYSGAAQDAWDRIAVLEAVLVATERERDEAQALLGVARNQRDAWKQTVVARTKDAAAAERRADEVEKALARVTSYRKHDPATASPERIRSFDSDHDDAEALLATAVVSADSLAAVPIYGGSTDDGHTFDLASPESAEARAATLEAALREIAEQQQKTLGWIRANGIVFDGPLGTDPSNWENVAFSIYADLCEVDTIARAALAAAVVSTEPTA